MNNIDILWIHNFLLIKYNKNEIAGENKEYEHWKSLYESVKEQKTTSNDVIQDIEKKMKEVENKQDMEQFSFYLIQAIPLLDQYKSLQKKQSKIYFMSPKDNCDADNTVDTRTRMITILKNYFHLVQTYFPDDYRINEWDKIRSTIETSQTETKTSSKAKCQVCNSDFSNFTIYENHFVCEKCGCVSTTTHSNISYKDIDRVNISSKYTYDRRTHFRDCINQYQGKQNASISKNVYDSLTQHFVSHGIVPENYASQSKEVAFKDVTKEHILLFLREIKQTKHYEDVVLIHHQLTGKPAPDISHLENVLLNDFDILVETYDRKFKNSERKNFINTQYVLFQLLKRHRFPCRKEDFNMLKTVDRKYFHDQICSELFSDIGWSFTALF
jgi:Poxvirus Late Transcription Factor VLTF3 like